MADTPAASTASSGGTFGFLSHKIAGKVPVWVVAVAGVGGYYWYTRYGPGKKSATAAMVTDPAGNQCTAVNPATGYCPGSLEDASALSTQQGGGGGGWQGGGTDGGTGQGNVTVPDVVGESLEDATTAVADAGLKISGGQADKPGSIRWVMTQIPTAGTRVTSGGTVMVTTSYGTADNPYPPGAGGSPGPPGAKPPVAPKPKPPVAKKPVTKPPVKPPVVSTPKKPVVKTGGGHLPGGGGGGVDHPQVQVRVPPTKASTPRTPLVSVPRR